MPVISKAFHNAVWSKAQELRDMDKPPSEMKLSEGNITAIISMVLARNGSRGYYVPRVTWRDGAKVVSGASLEVK